MKTATRRANKTAHAPNRKGGPGMIDFYKQRNETKVKSMNTLMWKTGKNKAAKKKGVR